MFQRRFLTIIYFFLVITKAEQYGVTPTIIEDAIDNEKSLIKEISILPYSQMQQIKVILMGESNFFFQNHSDYNISSISYLVVIDNNLVNADGKEISLKRTNFNRLMSTEKLEDMYKNKKELNPGKHEIYYFEYKECKIGFKQDWPPPNMFSGNVILTVRLVEVKGKKLVEKAEKKKNRKIMKKQSIKRKSSSSY